MVFLTLVILVSTAVNIIFLFLLLDIHNRVHNDDSSLRYCHIASSALVILLAIDYIHSGSRSSIFLVELFFFYFFSISIHYISLVKLAIDPSKKLSYGLILILATIISITLVIAWLETKVPSTGLPIKHNSTIFSMANFVIIVSPGILTSLLLTVRILRFKTPPSLEDILLVSRGSLSAVSSILIQLSSERIYKISYAIMVISYSLGILSVVVLNDNYYSLTFRFPNSNQLYNASSSWEEYIKSRKRRKESITNTARICAKNLSAHHRESKGWIQYRPIEELNEKTTQC